MFETDIYGFIMKFGLTQYTVDHFFSKVIERYPERPALASVGEKPFTYKEFGQRVDALKNTLRELGIKKGEKFLILGSSSPNWAIAFMALMTMELLQSLYLRTSPKQI